MIPHSKPFLGPEEALAVQQVVESGFVARGIQCGALEQELSGMLNLAGAVAVSSGTAGLHLALLALGAGDGVTVHIPSYVCIALWNAVQYCGAEASICDVDLLTGNISVEDVIRRRKSDGDIVIVPHMFGRPGPVRELKEAGFTVVEDCAQSIGAESGDELTGTIGDVSVFSFYATKVICAGEGGAVAVNSQEILDTVRDLCDYDHKDQFKLRFNYKMTDIQAAAARVQLKKLPSFIERRRKIAAEYDDVIASTRFELIDRPEGDIYFRYIIADNDVAGTIARLRAEGITAARPVFRPIHRYLGLEGYPNSEELQQSWISIPCYPAMTDAEVEAVCAAVLKAGSTCPAAK